MTTLLVGLVILLALLGAPVFACMIALAALGAGTVAHGGSFFNSFAAQLERVLALATGDNAKTLSTLPLFVFAGYLMAEAKTAKRLVAAADAWLGWLPGGLAVVTIMLCAFFTTVTGASGVTIVAIGGLMFPVLIKQGYGEKTSLGLVTSTGSIGLLLPPSLPLIVFGIVYAMSAGGFGGLSDGAAAANDFQSEAFWYSGIFPGLLLVVALSIYAIIVAKRAKIPTRRFELNKVLGPTLRALPELMLPVVILIPIIKAWLQIPEAAAFAVVYLFIFEVLIYRDLKLRQLGKIAREAMTLVGAIFIIIVAATALTNYFVDAQIPIRFYEWMERYISTKWGFLFALNALLLLVGCVMDIFSALMIVVPLIAPAALHYGVDPYHLGVIFLLNLELGYLTPAVGLNMLIATFRFRRPMTQVYPACLPFIGIILLTLVTVTYAPLVFPSTTKLLHLGVKARPSLAEAAAPVAAPPGGDPTQVPITWPDGGVWTPDRCETEEMKQNPMDQAECRATFKLFAQCQEITDQLSKLECEQKVLEGGDPFEPDATPGDGGPADASP